jgi:hypothetical protein
MRHLWDRPVSVQYTAQDDRPGTSSPIARKLRRAQTEFDHELVVDVTLNDHNSRNVRFEVSY